MNETANRPRSVLVRRIPDRLECFAQASSLPLTFGNFVRFHDYDPKALLEAKTDPA